MPRNSGRMASYAFKTHQKSLMGPYLPIHNTPKSLICTFSSPCEKSLIRDFVIFVSSSSPFFRPDFSLLEPVDALNFSLNKFRDAEGMHRRKAIFVFLPPIAKIGSSLALQQTENDAIFMRLSKHHTNFLVAAPQHVTWSPPCAPCGRWFFRSAGFSTTFPPNVGLAIRFVVRSKYCGYFSQLQSSSLRIFFSLPTPLFTYYKLCTSNYVRGTCITCLVQSPS